jgi:hypothetical protein
MNRDHPASSPAHGATPALAVVCRWCPATLTIAADPVADEFVWVDAAGGQYGQDADLPAHPYDHLEELGARMQASKYSDLAAARAYSSLKVRLTYGIFHTHHPAEAATPDWDCLGVTLPAVPVTHCGWPGWLRPSGWYCRRCKARLADSGYQPGGDECRLPGCPLAKPHEVSVAGCLASHDPAPRAYLGALLCPAGVRIAGVLNTGTPALRVITHQDGTVCYHPGTITWEEP